MWEDEVLKNCQFDIMIDDGLHQFNANICFLENSFFKLKNNGYYIIEDINGFDLEKFDNYMNNSHIIYRDIALLSLPTNNNCTDNNLLIIKK